MARAVDNAMQAERPEKAAMRKLWLQSIKKYVDGDDLLFFTLSGAEGLDIKHLIKSGLLETTETGALAPESAGKVVALESSPQAVIRLQSEIPGLKVIRGSVQEVLRGNSLVRFPNGQHEEACRARVINLDLNCPLEAEINGGEIEFPVLQWVRKFAQIHATQPRRAWTLLLTLHGEAHWSAQVREYVTKLLRDNFAASDQFRDGARAVIGEVLGDAIASGDSISLVNLSAADQQRILLLLVPKCLIRLSGDQEWRVETSRALRYGGNGKHAPMVTWIIEFRWEEALAGAPYELYKANLVDVVANVGQIDEKGKVAQDA